MAQIGYISSFLEAEGIGFLRSATSPEDLILFRRDAVAGELADLVSRIGLEVEYEVPAPARRSDDDDDDDDHHQVEATSVRPHPVPPGDKVEPLDIEAG